MLSFGVQKLSDGGSRASSHIIMARRVGWIGCCPKSDDGDCIVINFDRTDVAG